MNKKKKLIMIGLVLFSISIITLGTYALYNTALITGDASISSGEVKMSYSEKNEITLSNALPIKDDEGKLSTNYFDFSIMTYIKTNASDSTEYKMNYNIVLEPLTTTNPLSDSEIKVYLTKVENGVETAVVEPTTVDKLIQYIINSQEETFSNNKSEVVTNYRLRAWIDYDVDVTKFNEKTYSYKFRVNVNNEEAPVLTALTFAQSKVGTDGLEVLTHTTDDTLQVSNKFNNNSSGIRQLATTAELQVTNGTEYRYRGGDVNNYVTFNNETWRIIGILPTEDTDGNIENRFKIIRDESIGNYKWDSDTAIAYNYEENNNLELLSDTNEKKYEIIQTAAATGSGNNNWSRPSALNTYLNNTYYNSLTSEAQSMIGTTKYYLGGYSSADITVDAMWQYERKNSGSDYYYETNPIVQSDSSKKIAIMYASDYGYAASASCSNRLSAYDSDANCITTNNWLDKSQIEWLLNQMSANSSIAFMISPSGNVGDYVRFVGYGYVGTHILPVRPVLYLSSNVVISGGTGTSSDPYTLSM